MRKMMACLLVFCFLLGLLPTAAFAAESVESSTLSAEAEEIVTPETAETEEAEVVEAIEAEEAEIVQATEAEEEAEIVQATEAQKEASPGQESVSSRTPRIKRCTRGGKPQCTADRVRRT